MLKRLYLFLLTFLAPLLLAYADTVEQTMIASCMRESGQFSVRFDDVWNTFSLESAAIARRNTKPMSCVIEGVDLVARYTENPPRDRGACGAMQGGKLTLTIDRAYLLKDELVNWCYSSIMSVDVFFRHGSKEGEVKLCSRSAEGKAWECSYKSFSIPLEQPWMK